MSRRESGPKTAPEGKADVVIQTRGLLLLLVTAALLLLWGLGTRSLWAAEGRRAEVVREMLLTGDFLHPRIDGELYLDRSFPTYWSRAVIAVATGTLNELVVRLPSAIAGLIAIWATVKMGTGLWSARVGRLAGWFLLTTYGFVFWSRTGTADGENLAFIIGAVAWYGSRRDRLDFPAMLVFYVIVFVGALTGGLTAVVVPVLIVLPDMVGQRRWRLLLAPGHVLALTIGLLVYLSPFAYAILTETSGHRLSGWALVFRENIQFFRPFDHKGPVYFCGYQLPILLLPWTPLFVAGLAGMMKGWRGLDKHTRWLLWAMVLVFLLLTLTGARRSYHSLPMMPLCTLLMAVFVAEVHQSRVEAARRWGVSIQRATFTGLIAFKLALPLILIVFGRMMGLEVPLRFHVAALVIGVAAVLLGMIVMGLSRKASLPASDEKAIWPLIAVAVVLLGGYFCWQQSILETNRTERPFARQLREGIRHLLPERVAMYPKSNANLLFYLGAERPVKILENPDQLRRFAELGHSGVVIAQQRYAAGLAAEIITGLQRQRSLREHVWRWESKSSKTEKWVAWFWDDSSAVPLPAEVKGGTNDAP